MSNINVERDWDDVELNFYNNEVEASQFVEWWDECGEAAFLKWKRGRIELEQFTKAEHERLIHLREVVKMLNEAEQKDPWISSCGKFHVFFEDDHWVRLVNIKTGEAQVQRQLNPFKQLELLEGLYGDEVAS